MDALNVYHDKLAECYQLLKTIREGLDDHMPDNQPAAHDWSYVGDVGHVAEELAQIRDFLYSLGDYAPEEE